MIDRRLEKVLVTGAASGIGSAISRLLARQGTEVALLDRAEGLENMARDIAGRPFFIDLLQSQRIAEVVDAAAESLGGLDGVVNCAGIGSRTRLPDLAEDEWNRVVAINLTAPYLVCRAALPWLEASPNAAIVNVVSGTAVRPERDTGSGYAASKAGLLGLTRSLALQLAPSIRVNAVNPGLTNTAMVNLGDLESDQRQSALASYPLGRAADPSEVARVVAFLLSPDSSYITGSTYTIDGGRTLY